MIHPPTPAKKSPHMHIDKLLPFEIYLLYVSLWDLYENDRSRHDGRTTVLMLRIRTHVYIRSAFLTPAGRQSPLLDKKNVHGRVCQDDEDYSKAS